MRPHRHAIGLVIVCAAMLSASAATADPVPAVTPFEGAWVPKGQIADCKDGVVGAGGDGFLIEGRTIGSGDTVCTMVDMTVTKHIHYIRLDCHGLNKAFAGTKFVRIDRLDQNRILFRHQGEAPSEMERCR